MHCAFALMIGRRRLHALPQHRGAGVLGAYPLLVLWVVVVTGNHYWFDAAAAGRSPAPPPWSPSGCSPALAPRLVLAPGAPSEA